MSKVYNKAHAQHHANAIHDMNDLSVNIGEKTFIQMRINYMRNNPKNNMHILRGCAAVVAGYKLHQAVTAATNAALKDRVTPLAYEAYSVAISNFIVRLKAEHFKNIQANL